jgi:hypothetical protein
MIEIPEDPQVVFDKVAEHLLTQKERSEYPVNCACLYRGPKGLKCAAGCLIPDSDYNEEMEGKSWSTLVSSGIIPDTNNYLIGRLQRVHDVFDPIEWLTKLHELATEMNLDTSKCLTKTIDVVK